MRSKTQPKIWVKLNYDNNSQIKFKIGMLKFSLCD